MKPYDPMSDKNEVGPMGQILDVHGRCSVCGEVPREPGVTIGSCLCPGTTKATPLVAQSCECAAWDCRLHIDLPFEKADEKMKKGLVLIIDGCHVGPSRDDVFRERGEGYRLFREG